MKRKILISLLSIIVLCFVGLVLFYKIRTGKIQVLYGECFFELSSDGFLPPKDYIVKGLIEKSMGKIYIKFIKRESDDYDDTNVYYLWIKEKDVKKMFGRSMQEMESSNIRPIVSIKLESLLSGDYDIVTVQEVTWIEGLPYSYK